jgi:hypothetical protein
LHCAAKRIYKRYTVVEMDGAGRAQGKEPEG